VPVDTRFVVDKDIVSLILQFTKTLYSQSKLDSLIQVLIPHGSGQ
jgi:hypothetical protein